MKTRIHGKLVQTYDFTLVLSGVSDLTRSVLDALYEAGCDDALAGIRNGVVYLDFSREARSFQEAVLSAIHHVEEAGIGAMVVRVEPDEIVTAAEIARRTGRTREGIRKLQLGERGPGGFPQPVSSLRAASPLWRWSDVTTWFETTGLPGSAAPAEQRARSAAWFEACLLSAFNSMLSVRTMLKFGSGKSRISAFKPVLSELHEWSSRGGKGSEIAHALQQTLRIFFSEDSLTKAILDRNYEKKTPR